MSSQEFAALVIDGFPQVVDPYVSLAANLAASWFEETVPTVAAVTAEPIPVERLISSAQWALGARGEQGLARLERTAQRAVFDGARETTLLNVDRSNVRWARDASPDACAFCRMLATRTSALYRSRDTAATKVHDDCRCVPVEVLDPDDYELPDHAQQWEQEYLKARANAGTGEPGRILSAWREIYGTK